MVVRVRRGGFFAVLLVPLPKLIHGNHGCADDCEDGHTDQSHDITAHRFHFKLLGPGLRLSLPVKGLHLEWVALLAYAGLPADDVAVSIFAGENGCPGFTPACLQVSGAKKQVERGNDL